VHLHAQFSGDIASMEALSVGKFKARSKEIQANAMKGMAIANALSSINQYVVCNLFFNKGIILSFGCLLFSTVRICNSINKLSILIRYIRLRL
jgi:hypothetical protein